MTHLPWLLLFLRALLAKQLHLAAENLALRQQLAILSRQQPRPRLRLHDRLFWLCLSRLWFGWKDALIVVSPATVVRWHRQGFRYWWAWKSRRRQGRPPLDAEVSLLIRRLSRENQLWGTPRIQAELHLLGHDVARSTIDKYRVRGNKPPSPTWKAFLKNHAGSLASMDFFVVPTATFGLLYAFVILRHDRRRIVHCNVTAHPTQQWVATQLREAFPFDTAPRYLIRDRDSIYGDEVRRCLINLGMKEVVIAPRSPWQNPFVERLVGTIRREVLDHVIVLGERHLRRLLHEYVDSYYHPERCHQGLGGNAPEPHAVQPPTLGPVTTTPLVGGLHHRYRRAA